MIQKASKKKQDAATRKIYALVKKRFPECPDQIEKVVYRYNPASIRVRIIDSAFDRKNFSERETLVEDLLQELPENVRRDITLLLLLSPTEADDPSDLMNLEFDDPSDSRL